MVFVWVIKARNSEYCSYLVKIINYINHIMKKITLLMFLLSVVYSYSQTYDLLENFDTVTTGVTWLDDNGSTISTVENTPVSGTNAIASDGNYGQIITQQASAPWQAGALIMQDNFLDLENQRTIQVDVYSDAPTFILAKAVGALGGGADGATDASHPGGGWVTLTFDFDVPKDGAAAAAKQFESVFFFPNWNGAGWDGTCCGEGGANNSPVTTTLYDNLRGLAGILVTCANGVQDGDETGIDCGGSCNECPNPSVFNLLENFDTVATGVTWLDDNGSTISTVENTPISGTNAVASDGNYGQIITQQASAPWQAGALIMQNNYLDLATQREIQVDIYSDSPTFILAKAVGAVGGGTDGATDASHPGGGWATLTFNFNVPKDGPPADAKEFESVFFFPNWNGAGWDGTCCGEGGANNSPVATTLYDNLRGLAGASLGSDDFNFNDLKVFPNPTTDNWIIKTANEKITSIQVYDILGKQVYISNPNSSEATISSLKLSNGIYFAKVKTINGESNLRLVKN